MKMRSYTRGCIVVALVAALAGCGSGDGGTGAEDEASAARLKAALAALLADPMDDELTDVAIEIEAAVAETFATSESPREAWAKLNRAYAAVVLDGDDLSRLGDNSRRLGGRVVDAGVPGSASILQATELVTGDPVTNIMYVNGLGVEFGQFVGNVENLAQLVAEEIPDCRTSGVYQASTRELEQNYLGRDVCPLADSVPVFFPLCQGVGWTWVQATITRWITVEGILFPFQIAAELAAAVIQNLPPGGRQVFEAGERRSLDAGGRVVLVAHDQGNYLVREALAIISQTDAGALSSIGAVMVGSPMDRTEITRFLPDSHVERVRIEEDIIAAFGGSCEDDCVSISRRYPPAEPITNHYFSQSYLGAPEARARVLDAIRDVRDAMR